MSRRVLIVHNPASRAGLNQSTRLNAAVSFLVSKRHGVEVQPTTGPGSACEFVRKEGGRFDWVIAAGGDGTVREVVTGLVRGGHESLLGVLPLGTGNDVARLVGTASDGAFRTAVESEGSRPMDAIGVRFTASELESPAEAEVGLLFAAVGFSSELLRHTTPRVKRWFGPRLCYSIGFFRALVSYRPAQVTVTSAGRRVEGKLLLACAANSPHAGGGVMQLAPGARLQDGRLNMSIIQQVSPFTALRQFPALLRGTHVKDPRVDYFEAEQMHVETDRPVPVAIDGDLVGTTPAWLEVLPARIRVLSNSVDAH